VTIACGDVMSSGRSRLPLLCAHAAPPHLATLTPPPTTGGRRWIGVRCSVCVCGVCQEKHNEILKYNNRLAALQSRLDQAESETLQRALRWASTNNMAASKTLLIGRIQTCVPLVTFTCISYWLIIVGVPSSDTLTRSLGFERYKFVTYLLTYIIFGRPT